MRKYLEFAFEYFEYEKNDAQYLISVYDKIVENPEALKLWNSGISMYENDIMCNHEEILKTADNVAEILSIYEYTTELLMYICLTRHAKKIYEEHNIAESIFKNTMLDLRYKLDECKIVKGITGTFVAHWFREFFTLERFALGRLQFEIKHLDKIYEKNGIQLDKESKVINMHIPRSGEPLTPKLCEEAFDLAKEFYKEEFSETVPFVCSSWLLFPENKNILSKESNTYKFIERFDIIDTRIYKTNSELWRLFDTDEQNPDRLPADTSMRRAYINLLKNGGRTGGGFGIFIR